MSPAGLGRTRAGTRRRALLLAPVVLLLSLVLPVQVASAHPLDVYLHGSYLTVGPSRIAVELDLSAGVLVAPAVLAQLDADHDKAITDAEGRAYANAVLQTVQVAVDGQSLSVALATVDVPSYVVMQSGYGTIKIQAEAPGAPGTAGTHVLTYRNGYTGAKVKYQANAFVPRGGGVTLGAQERSATQQDTRISYTLGAQAPGAAPAAPSAGTQAQPAAGTSRLMGYLEGAAPSGWAVVIALSFAALLGALHALTPGHAKTLMAAYLVGSGGTVRNALTLGAVVTVTHTASVIVIGLLALLASQFLVPSLLVPGLEIVSGLLVLGLGLRLLRERWRTRASSASRSNHDHDHDHPHDHDHQHEAGRVLQHAGGPVQGRGVAVRDLSEHTHGGKAHIHELPAGGLTPRSLIAIGVSGGLVPCPEALGVMVLAVGVNRTVLGLGLILSFSVGLAAVLMGLGLVLVRSRTLLARFGSLDSRWIALLPLLSAGIVTVLGLGLLLSGAGGRLPL